MKDADEKDQVAIPREIVDRFIKANNEGESFPLAEGIERVSFAVVRTLVRGAVDAVMDGRELAPEGARIADLRQLQSLLRAVELLRTMSDRMPHLSLRSVRIPANPETLRRLEEFRRFDPVDRMLLRQAAEKVEALLELQFRTEKEVFESAREEGTAKSSPDVPLENQSGEKD